VQALWGGGHTSVCGLSYELLESADVHVLKLLSDRSVSDTPFDPRLRRAVGLLPLAQVADFAAHPLQTELVRVAPAGLSTLLGGTWAALAVCTVPVYRGGSVGVVPTEPSNP
jgi:hypothetical protein